MTHTPTTDTPTTPAAPGEAEIHAAQLLLARLGITITDLLAATPSTPGISTPTTTTPTAPTFDEYIPHTAAGAPTTVATTYRPYWKRVQQLWGDRRIDEPTPSDIRHLCETIRATTARRRNHRDGASAVLHLLSALRYLYTAAENDNLIDHHRNPAAKTPLPRPATSTRHALSATQLTQINHTAATTGNDPALDTLLLRLHTETACRRGGALALRPCDLNPTDCLIRLREKGHTQRWQPVSPTLMTALRDHATERGATDPYQPLLRYGTGRSRHQPLTPHRYDNMWNRLGRHLPFITQHGITTHWIRHTTLTWVERHHGYAIAQAYAGHHTPHAATGTTVTYVKATLEEIATALATLTHEPHPLAMMAGAA